MTAETLPAPVPGEAFLPNSEAQAIAYWSWAPIVAYSGRLGSAKSRTLLEAADYDCRRWPGNKVAMCRKKAVDLFGSVLDIFLNEVIHENQRHDWKAHTIGGATMFYPNGSRMVWFGLDDPGKALGAQYGSIYVDQAEQLDEAEVRTIEGRARLNVKPVLMENGILLPVRHRIVYAFNPDADYHWANARFGFKEMQNGGNPDPSTWSFRKSIRTEEPRELLDGTIAPAGTVIAEVVIARPTDNVRNLPAIYQLVLSGFKGPYRLRMVGGVWGTFEGQAFPDFSETTHVLTEPPAEWGWQEWGGYPPPSWKRYRSVDFGYENPFVMSWITRVPADCPKYPGAWVHYREIYRTHAIVSVHAKQAKEYDREEVAALNRGIERWNSSLPPGTRPMEQKTRLSYAMQVCDHDAEDRATLESEGIIMDPAVKDRSSGIQEVYNALDPETGPKLLFMRNACREIDDRLKVPREGDKPRPTCTWREISGLRWPKKPDSSEKGPKEDLVKVDDHGFDCVRYLLRSFRDRGDIHAVRLFKNQPRDDEDD